MGDPPSKIAKQCDCYCAIYSVNYSQPCQEYGEKPHHNTYPFLWPMLLMLPICMSLMLYFMLKKMKTLNSE